MAPDSRGPSYPTNREVREKATAHNIPLDRTEADALLPYVKNTLDSYATVDRLADSEPNNVPERDGYRPSSDENPYNAFVTKCTVSTGSSGPLEGYSIGLKDNIALAGIEMTCGSAAFEGYVPSRDATVVTRLLDAGGTITGKMNMDAMGFGGSGELSDMGPALNPHDTDYLTGGSSGGNAAAIAGGAVDVAIGTDAGGSVRRPAAWCGCVGLKPTYGLIPYTGIVSQAPSIDHAGVMARNVRDCALTLEVIAGDDGLDPRQRTTTVKPYTDAIQPALEQTSSRVGIVPQGFGQNPDATGLDQTVRSALEQFEACGATLETCSIPLHDDGAAIWTAINLEEMAALVQTDGLGRFARGYYDTQYAETFANVRREDAESFPPTFKLALITGQYLADEYQGRYYARGQNLRRKLVRAYDRALETVDVLAMPTIPSPPQKVKHDLTQTERIDRSLGLLTNRAPFNATGHPAISIPCGQHDGLPVGLSLIGKRGSDETVLRVADAFERLVYRS